MAPSNRRAEFINTAQQLFFTKGYESTSINDIINALGVSKGAFYHYFESKQAILEALVAELAAQTHVLFEVIVTDKTLNAIQKWTQAIQMIGNWKIERKAELIALLHMMLTDKNVLLRHKLLRQKVQMVVPELAKIIAQGIEEGVFETACVEESAAIVYAISTTFSDTLADILLNPDNYDDPDALARRKFMAVQTAIERVLGAAPGSLPLVDENMIKTWIVQIQGDE